MLTAREWLINKGYSKWKSDPWKTADGRILDNLVELMEEYSAYVLAFRKKFGLDKAKTH